MKKLLRLKTEDLVIGMPVRIPEEVKTEVEKWVVPLGAGGLMGYAAYSLAKENPTVWGIAAGIVTAFLVTR